MKPTSAIAPFVHEILFLESAEDKQHTFSFYADGYPGLMYSETSQPILLLPKNKQLSEFFIYGQTLEPIQLEIQGAHKAIVFKLYPFATRLLLGIDPRGLNDECYDLHQRKEVDTAATVEKLKTLDTQQQIAQITDYILQLVKHSAGDVDKQIKFAVSTIIRERGNITIAQLREQLYITERTFERRFSSEIGVSPKQFCKIVQFNFSLNQIQEEDYTKLTNVAYDNGFTDQSHFIRTFRKYTDKTPKEFLSELI